MHALVSFDCAISLCCLLRCARRLQHTTTFDYAPVAASAPGVVVEATCAASFHTSAGHTMPSRIFCDKTDGTWGSAHTDAGASNAPSLLSCRGCHVWPLGEGVALAAPHLRARHCTIDAGLCKNSWVSASNAQAAQCVPGFFYEAGDTVRRCSRDSGDWSGTAMVRARSVVCQPRCSLSMDHAAS